MGAQESGCVAGAAREPEEQVRHGLELLDVEDVVCAADGGEHGVVEGGGDLLRSTGGEVIVLGEDERLETLANGGIGAAVEEQPLGGRRRSAVILRRTSA